MSPKNHEDEVTGIMCMECGQAVEADRAASSIRACKTCMPPLPPPVLGQGDTARIVAEMTGKGAAPWSAAAAKGEVLRWAQAKADAYGIPLVDGRGDAEDRAVVAAAEIREAAGTALVGLSSGGGVVVRAERSEDGAIRGTITNNTPAVVTPRVTVTKPAAGELPSFQAILGRELTESERGAIERSADEAERERARGPSNALALARRVGTKHPPIVTLCGSTRFRREFEAATYSLTLAGWAVLSVGCFGRAAHDHESRNGLTPRQKEELDALHLKKIAMSERVHVLNPGGYIGESTAREIGFAFGLGMRITFLDEEAGEAWLTANAHKLGREIAGHLLGKGARR